MPDVSPPATGTWWDPAATLANMLATLRLQGGDIDTARLQTIIPASARTIEHDLDPVTVLDGPPPDPLIQYELERRTLEMYRSDIPTAAISVTTTWLPEAGSKSVISGFRQRWGAA